MISFGLCSLRQTLDLVEVDQVIVLPDAVLDGVEPFAGLRRRRAVGQVAARGEAQAHERVAGLKQRHHHRAVGLRCPNAAGRWRNSQPKNFFARSIASVSTVSDGAQP